MKRNAESTGAVSIGKRIALSMIEAAEASGELSPGRTIIEPASGRTGAGLGPAALIAGL